MSQDSQRLKSCAVRAIHPADAASCKGKLPFLFSIKSGLRAAIRCSLFPARNSFPALSTEGYQNKPDNHPTLDILSDNQEIVATVTCPNPQQATCPGSYVTTQASSPIQSSASVSSPQLCYYLLHLLSSSVRTRALHCHTPKAKSCSLPRQDSRTPCCPGAVISLTSLNNTQKHTLQSSCLLCRILTPGSLLHEFSLQHPTVPQGIKFEVMHPFLSLLLKLALQHDIFPPLTI